MTNEWDQFVKDFEVPGFVGTAPAVAPVDNGDAIAQSMTPQPFPDWVWDPVFKSWKPPVPPAPTFLEGGLGPAPNPMAAMMGGAMGAAPPPVPTPPQPFFNNPVMQEQDIRFDASVDPNGAGRNGPGLLGGAWNLASAPLPPEVVEAYKFAGGFAGDVAPYVSPVAGVAEGVSSLLGGPSLSEAGEAAGGFIAPRTIGEGALELSPWGLAGDIGLGGIRGARMAERGFGGALLGNNLDTLPDVAGAVGRGLDDLGGLGSETGAVRIPGGEGPIRKQFDEGWQATYGGKNLAEIKADVEAAGYTPVLNKNGTFSVAKTKQAIYDQTIADATGAIDSSPPASGGSTVPPPAVGPQNNVTRIAVREGSTTPAPEGLAASRGAEQVSDPSGVRILGPGEEPGPGESLRFHGGNIQGDIRPDTFVTPNEADAAVFAKVDDQFRGLGDPPNGGGGGNGNPPGGNGMTPDDAANSKRGGINWQLAGTDFTDKSKAMIENKLKFTIDEIADTKDRMWRGVTSAIGGDVRDPITAKIINGNKSLSAEIFQAEWDEVRRIGSQLDGQINMDEAGLKALAGQQIEQLEDVANKVHEANRLYREKALESIPDPVRRKAAQEEFIKLDIALESDIAHKMRIMEATQRPIKNMVLGLDAGIVLQQGLRGARMGLTSVGTSLVSRAAEQVMRVAGREANDFGIWKLGDNLSPREEMVNWGLIQKSAVNEGAVRSAAEQAADDAVGRKLGWKTPFHLGNKALETWTNAQFAFLDKMREETFRGRLIQEKLLRGGAELPDSVYRDIAQFANTAGSTANLATSGRRAAAEGAFELTPGMTRAQFAEIAQPLKAFTSPTQATNFLNQVASTGITFATAYAIQQAAGMEETFEDFLKRAADPRKPYEFGRILLNDSGKFRKTDFLSQFSLERAVLKSIQDAKHGDLWGVAGQLGKFGYGRLNFLPADVASIGGSVGYGKHGKFYTNWENEDMPVGERFMKAAPIPLGLRQSVIEKDRSPLGIGVNIAGGQSYIENDFDRTNRIAQQQHGREYKELDPMQRVAINKQLIEQGNPPAGWMRASPWEDGREATYLKQAQELGLADKYPTTASLKAELLSRTLKKYPDLSEADAKEIANDVFDDALFPDLAKDTKLYREDIIRADPDLVQFLSNPSQEVRELAERIKAGK
jgi:hypothetical protein